MYRLLAAAVATTLGLAPAASAAFEIKPFATLQHDVVRVQGDGDGVVDDVDGFRRLRAGLRLGFGERVDGKFEYDFINNRWNDMVLAFAASDAVTVRAGHFKPPMGLEELGSSSWSGFGERAAMNAFVPGRRFGAELRWASGDRGVALMAFGQDSVGELDGQGLAARGTWAWRPTDGRVGHLGLSLGHEQPDDDSLRLSRRPDVSLVGFRAVDTGSFDGVDDIGRYGLEGAWQAGPLLLQGEWMGLEASRDAAPDFSGEGGYLAAQWMSGGHVRRYGDGIFGGPDLSGTELAWEFGLRLDHLDLDDGGVDGGTMDTLTLGASLYVGRRARFIANLVDADSDRRGVERSPRMLMLRAQFLY